MLLEADASAFRSDFLPCFVIHHRFSGAQLHLSILIEIDNSCCEDAAVSEVLDDIAGDLVSDFTGLDESEEALGNLDSDTSTLDVLDVSCCHELASLTWRRCILCVASLVQQRELAPADVGG